MPPPRAEREDVWQLDANDSPLFEATRQDALAQLLNRTQRDYCAIATDAELHQITGLPRHSKGYSFSPLANL